MQMKSSKKQFIIGILQFAWAELKTMNWVKLKILFKITVAYILMKYFKRKKTDKNLELKKLEQNLLRETSYRLSS